MNISGLEWTLQVFIIHVNLLYFTKYNGVWVSNVLEITK